jgi:hypothetical protein
MADSTKIDVYAMTPGHTFSIPISMGLPNNNIRAINPVRQGNGLWIGKMKPEPENADLINCEIVVGRDKVTSDYQYYYTDLSVAEVIDLINNGPTPPPELSLKLTFNSIENADVLVGDASDVADWNTFFDLPTYGTPFSSVSVVGNVVDLFGGSGITVKEQLFQKNPDCLVSIVDTANCIVLAQQNSFAAFSASVLTTVDLPALTRTYNFCFNGCTLLANLSLPALEIADLGCFYGCISLTTFDFPVLESTGVAVFNACTTATIFNLPFCTNLGGTVDDNLVFGNIIGQNITLTVPAFLMICNGGFPDGDIQFLQANNTVTVITV